MASSAAARDSPHLQVMLLWAGSLNYIMIQTDFKNETLSPAF